MYIFLIIPSSLNKIKYMRELIHTQPAELYHAHYILEAQASIDAEAGYTYDVSEDAQRLIEKRIANPDHRKYIMAMAGNAIIGTALLVETPIPVSHKRGQYIDMMSVTAGSRTEEIEARLLAHAAQIAIMNSPTGKAESSFLRIDPLTRTNNVSTKSLRLRGETLARCAYGKYIP